MTAVLSNDMPSAPGPGFKPRHAWDRWFFPVLIAVFWLGIVMGFGGDMMHRAQLGQLSFPLIIHVHAVAYVGWMVLLTTQLTLIRRGKTALHRRLGLASLGLVAVMLILGPMAAFTTQVARFGQPGSDPAFLAIQLGGLVSFTGLIVAAILNRANSPLHKRLVLLATLTLVDAGFARWVGPIWGPVLGPALHSPFWTSYLIYYGVTAGLMLVIGLYDLVTRGRLLPGYLMGLAWAYGWHFAIVTAYLNPTWIAFTKAWVAGMAGA